MDYPLTLPDTESPSSITEVVQALRKQGLDPSHDKKNWGDWINLQGHRTVISIESMRGLARSATIEHDENDPDCLLPDVFAAFRSLAWVGIDEDGEYAL